MQEHFAAMAASAPANLHATRHAAATGLAAAGVSAAQVLSTA
jgi:hypothetical protein